MGRVLSVGTRVNVYYNNEKTEEGVITSLNFKRDIGYTSYNVLLQSGLVENFNLDKVEACQNLELLPLGSKVKYNNTTGTIIQNLMVSRFVDKYVIVADIGTEGFGYGKESMAIVSRNNHKLKLID